MSENRRDSGRPPSNDPLEGLSAALEESLPAASRSGAHRAAPYRQGSNLAATVCLVCGFGEILSLVLLLLTDVCAFGLGVLAFPIIGGISGLIGVQQGRRTGVGKTAAAVGMFLCMLPVLLYIIIFRASSILRFLSG